MAPQLTAMNGALARRLALCSARASNSLPVPLGPRIRMLASEPATSLASASNSAICALRLISSARQLSSPDAGAGMTVDKLIAYATFSISSLPSNGFVR